MAPSTYELHHWELVVGALLLLITLFCLARNIYPLNIWIIWSLLFLCPFVFVQKQLVIDWHTGPARYLYIASAGSSFIISFSLRYAVYSLCSRFSYKLKRIAHVASIVLLLTYGCIMVKKAEAFSFYSSARTQMATLNHSEGIILFKKSMEIGFDIIDAQDAYERMILVLLTDIYQADQMVNEALDVFPKSVLLNVYKLIIDSVSDDVTARAQAQAKLGKIGENPDIAEVIEQGYHNLAMGYYDKEEWSKAALSYEKSLFFLPDKLLSLRRLTYVYTKQKRYDEIVPILEKIISIDGNDTKSQYGLGTLYLVQGDTSRSEQIFNRILDAHPDSPEAQKIVAKGWQLSQ